MVNVAHALFDQASNPNLHHIKKRDNAIFSSFVRTCNFCAKQIQNNEPSNLKIFLTSLFMHCAIDKMKGCFVIFNSSFTEQNYEHLFLDMAKGIMKANELYAQNSYQLWLITCQGEQIIITWLLAGLHNPQLAPRCIQLNILTIWTLVWYDRVGKNVASKRNVVLSTT